MTPKQAQKIKKIKSNIAALEKQVPKIVNDKKKREKWVSDIADLKIQIDLVERQTTKEVVKNGKVTKETNLDFGAFKQDMEEHETKLYHLLNEILPLYPNDWEDLLKSTCYSPISAKDLKNIQTLLVKAKTELQALIYAVNFYSNAFKKEEENGPKPEMDQRAWHLITGTNKDIKDKEETLDRLQQYADNYFTVVEEPKQEKEEKKESKKAPPKKEKEEKKEDKSLMIHNGNYKLIPKIEGEIKLNTGKVIPIKIEKLNDKKEFTIPQNAEGTLELKVFLAFKFNDLETAYTHTKNISASIKSDSNGKVAFISMAHNEASSSKDLIDILIAETVKALKKQEEKFKKKHKVPQKHPLPEKDFYDFVNKQVKQQTMTTGAEATHGENSPVINIAYSLITSDLNISMNATVDGGVTFPVEATIEGGTGIGVDVKGTKNSGGVQLVLLAAEERLDIDDELTVKFNKEKEITLDETDKKQLDVWWREIQEELKKTIEKEEASKEGNKDIPKDKLERKVERKLNKILTTPTAYTIKITGFASTTGKDSENKAISNDRAKSIEKYLKNTLNVKGKILIATPDGEDTCLKSNEDNKAVDECRKATVYFLTN